jgi:hypothetical protein
VPIGAECMDRASATDLGSAALLAPRNRLRRCSHRPAAGSAAKGRRRRGPIRQDGEVLSAGMTDPASHPNVFVPVIVGLAQPLSMADDRVVAANRTSPRQEVQRNYPRSMLSFASGSTIKIITAGEGPPTSCQFASGG